MTYCLPALWAYLRSSASLGVALERLAHARTYPQLPTGTDCPSRAAWLGGSYLLIRFNQASPKAGNSKGGRQPYLDILSISYDLPPLDDGAAQYIAGRSLAAVSVLLLAFAALASHAPVRRSARVDPAEVLRAE